MKSTKPMCESGAETKAPCRQHAVVRCTIKSPGQTPFVLCSEHAEDWRKVYEADGFDGAVWTII